MNTDFKRKQKILIDFDKTISPVHGFYEPPSTETILAIKALHEKFEIHIYSCRANPEICSRFEYLSMIEYLNKYDIPFDGVYANKPIFVALIDDRSFNPQKTSWAEIAAELLS